MADTVRYLSLAWLDELSRAVAADDDAAAAGGRARDRGHPARGRRPGGRRHLPPPGRRRRGPLRAGAAEPEHVRMEQSWDTAVAVATGELNAQEAFVNGHIRLFGDQQRLLDVAAGVRRPRCRVRRRPHADRVRLSRRARDARGPGARRAADRRLHRPRLKRFVPLTFTALKTVLPAPDTAYGLPLLEVGRRGKYLLVRVRAGDVHRPPDAGRTAARRHQAGGQAARRAGPLRLRRHGAGAAAHRAGHRAQGRRVVRRRRRRARRRRRSTRSGRRRTR